MTDLDGGIYQILIRLGRDRWLTVGALGRHRFAAGWYVYTGSMRRGLTHRLRRHAARRKPLRWHVDYLTVAGRVVDWRCEPLRDVAEGELPQECAAHHRLLKLPGVAEPVPGFGSSDCRCRSHLVYLGAGPGPFWWGVGGVDAVDGADGPP